MTINYCNGDLFSSEADAYAHGCNAVGRMGAGIAREFKNAFPRMFADYVERAASGLLVPGSGYVFHNERRPHVINLVTQEDLDGARREFVESSLDWLAQLNDVQIQSVAMPRIGAGLGGLRWRDVRREIERRFYDHRLSIEVWDLPD